MFSAINLLVFAALAINVFILTRNIHRGVGAYLLFAATCPNANLGGQAVSFEILSMPLLLISFLPHVHRLKSNPAQIIGISIYFGTVVISTLLSLVQSVGELEPFALIGTLRLWLMALLFSQFLDKKTSILSLASILTINAFACLIQILIPDTVSLFHEMYSKDSARSLSSYVDLGFFPRCTGTFATPVSLSVMSLVSFAVFFPMLLAGFKRSLMLPLILMSIFCGILAASKLFLLALPVLIILTSVATVGFGDKGKSKGMALQTIAVTIVISTASLFIIQNQYQDNSFFRYSVDSAFNLQVSMSDRYGAEEGILSEAQNVISRNLILGLGKTSEVGEFVGDSSYALILHDTGLVGFFIMLGVLMGRLWHYWSRREIIGLAAMVAILLSGVSSTQLLDLFGILILTGLPAGDPSQAPEGTDAPVQTSGN